MPGESRISARKIVARERELRALELRKGGATIDEIARQMGISRSGAHRALRRGMAKLDDEIRESARELLSLQIARLEELYAMLRQRIEAHPETQAIRVAAQIIRDIADLLLIAQGASMNAPTMVQLVRLSTSSLDIADADPSDSIDAQAG